MTHWEPHYWWELVRGCFQFLFLLEHPEDGALEEQGGRVGAPALLSSRGQRGSLTHTAPPLNPAAAPILPPQYLPLKQCLLVCQFLKHLPSPTVLPSPDLELTVLSLSSKPRSSTLPHLSIPSQCPGPHPHWWPMSPVTSRPRQALQWTLRFLSQGGEPGSASRCPGGMEATSDGRLACTSPPFPAHLPWGGIRGGASVGRLT